MKIYKPAGKYLNKQKYSECQLVTVINAATFYDKKLVITDQEYERLVDLTRGRSGSCLNIDAAVRYFGLSTSFIKPNLDLLYSAVATKKQPVGVSVYHRDVGFHNVLVVGCNGFEYEVLNLPRFKRRLVQPADMHVLVGGGTLPNIKPYGFHFCVYTKGDK